MGAGVFFGPIIKKMDIMPKKGLTNYVWYYILTQVATYSCILLSGVRMKGTHLDRTLTGKFQYSIYVNDLNGNGFVILMLFF